MPSCGQSRVTGMCDHSVKRLQNMNGLVIADTWSVSTSEIMAENGSPSLKSFPWNIPPPPKLLSLYHTCYLQDGLWGNIKTKKTELQKIKQDQNKNNRCTTLPHTHAQLTGRTITGKDKENDERKKGSWGHLCEFNRTFCGGVRRVVCEGAKVLWG